MGSKLHHSSLYNALYRPYGRSGRYNTSVCTNMQHTHSLCLSQRSLPANIVLPTKIITTILRFRQIWPRLAGWQYQQQQQSSTQNTNKALMRHQHKCHIHDPQLNAATISHNLVVLLSNPADIFGAAAHYPA